VPSHYNTGDFIRFLIENAILTTRKRNAPASGLKGLSNYSPSGSKTVSMPSKHIAIFYARRNLI